MPDGSRHDAAGYEVDYYFWSQRQAARLRALGAAGLDEEVDWENVAEEIESLGRADRREIGSRLETILEHLLKLRFSPAEEPRRGWSNTVRRERRLVEGLLRESPSLRAQVDALLAERVDLAFDAAVGALTTYGEAAARTMVLADAHALAARVLDEGFIPHPPGAAT